MGNRCVDITPHFRISKDIGVTKLWTRRRDASDLARFQAALGLSKIKSSLLLGRIIAPKIPPTALLCILVEVEPDRTAWKSFVSGWMDGLI